LSVKIIQLPQNCKSCFQTRRTWFDDCSKLLISATDAVPVAPSL